MKNLVIIGLSAITVISLVLNWRFYSSQKQTTLTAGELVNAKVTKVIDGDTLDIETGDRLRFYEIDAPENPKGCLGVDAKTRLEDLVLDKTIRIQRIRVDSFGRTLANVFIDELFINQLMVEEGLAYYYKDKNPTTYSLTIEKTQEKARLAGRGVWSALCQTKKEGCVIKGNYRSAENTRIYHTPDCYNYDRITIKPGTTDRWFCTEGEAKAAGFVKSKDCP